MRVLRMKCQRYLNHHTKEAIAFRSDKYTWREEYNKFEEQHKNPDRLVNSLFSNSDYILKRVNPQAVMNGLYSIAIGMQNIETSLSFFDIFEKQEVFDLWQCRNFKTYVNDANYAGNNGLMFQNCKPVLRDIIEHADRVIAAKGKGANFRFAHDGNIIPLALLLHLEGTYNSVSESAEFYKAWSDFKVAPMAGNIQIVFFRNKKNPDDVIVKFLLHENETAIPPVKTDMAPYYRWEDIRAFYMDWLER